MGQLLTLRQFDNAAYMQYILLCRDTKKTPMSFVQWIRMDRKQVRK